MDKFEKKKYAGKSKEYIALKDYSQILDAYYDEKDGGNIKGLESVIKKLNNFIPTVGCKYPGCDNRAYDMTIAITYGEIPISKDGTKLVHGPTDISVSTDYVWCKKHKDTNTGYEKAFIYPIKFNILRQIPVWPQWVRQEVQKVLLKCAGFEGNITEKKAHTFINSLLQKGDMPGIENNQEPLFDDSKITQLNDNFYSNDEGIKEVEKCIKEFAGNPTYDLGEKLSNRLDGIGFRKKESIDKLIYLSKKYGQNCLGAIISILIKGK